MNHTLGKAPNGEWPASDTAAMTAGFMALRRVMAEAQQLGVRVRLQGAGVLFAGLEALPADLRGRLEALRDVCWHWLGGDDLDEPALDLLDVPPIW